jgi:Putative MetA-pathway of phenol degradation
MRQCLTLTAILLCGAGALPARADAPPYATTDTDIADKLELSSFVRSAGHDGRQFNTMGFDLAVPLAPRWEFTLVPRFAQTRGGAHDDLGLGDTEVAVKYLLLAETDARPAIALEPNMTFPTGGQRLGEGRVAVEIPVLISKSFGPWKVSGQVGFERVGLKANDDHAPVSLLVERTITERLSLGAELANDLPMRRPGQGSTEANVGAAWTFRDGLKLQTAFGRRLASRDATADLHSTVALAVEF